MASVGGDFRLPYDEFPPRRYAETSGAVLSATGAASDASSNLAKKFAGALFAGEMRAKIAQGCHQLRVAIACRTLVVAPFPVGHVLRPNGLFRLRPLCLSAGRR